MAETEREVNILKPITITPREYAEGYEFAPLHEPLGAIVMVFAQLEAKLTMTVDTLLGITYPDGVALEDLMQSTTARIKLFHTLAALKTTGIFIDKLNGKTGLRARLDKCNAYRNDYVHGLWTGLHPDGSFTKVRYKADTGLHSVKSTVGVSLTKLWEAHEFIFVTALDLESWRFAFNHRERTLACIMARKIIGTRSYTESRSSLNPRHAATLASCAGTRWRRTARCAPSSRARSELAFRRHRARQRARA